MDNYTYRLQKQDKATKAWVTVGYNFTMTWEQVTTLYAEHENDAWFMTGEPCKLRIKRSDGLIMREQK